jgi:hypothetical protein
VRFWDTSALLPLFVAEKETARARRPAERLVSVHPLRAADAVQLGAALVAADLDPAGLELVTFDERLATAAEKEGFSVLGA